MFESESMKWLRMLGLYFERMFEYRLRSFVWILIPIINNSTLILFWKGTGNSSSEVSTYYILMTLVGLLTTSHTEYEVAEIDIKQGGLSNYLTKPLSYYFIQLLAETPYRECSMEYTHSFFSVDFSSSSLDL